MAEQKPIFVDYYKGMILACDHVAKKERVPEIQKDGVLACASCRDALAQNRDMSRVHTVHPEHLQTESGKWWFEEKREKDRLRRKRY